MPSTLAYLSLPLLILRTVSSFLSPDGGVLPAYEAVEPQSTAQWSYSVVDGLLTVLSLQRPHLRPLVDSFGLLDKSPSRRKRIKREIEQLNEESDERTSAKVLFVARHGQGYHNVAETKYGTAEWDRYWSKLNGDNEMTWGPDALLTPLGMHQATAVQHAWRKQLEAGVPLPEKLYSSPLSRAAKTLELTWDGILLSGGSEKEQMVRPELREGLREAMGVHTCDRRRARSYLSSSFPSFSIDKGFTEEDELWSPTERETDLHLDARIRSQLDSIFDDADHPSYVSITAHGGVIGAVFRTVGHQKITVPPGGMVPIVVKAVRVTTAEQGGALRVQQAHSP